jgi:uncharacterized protein YcbX
MHISQLFIYPVKSLRGFSVQTATLTPQGLQYDRQWMIINENNTFVTQRKMPHMVLIHTRIEKNRLVLSVPSKPQLPPLTIDMLSPPTSPAIEATVWKDTCSVIDEGKTASDWLHRALGNTKHTLRLVRMATVPRPQSQPHLLGKHTHTYFADAAPFLITNTASLKRVNQQLQAANYDTVPMENFRPNIVITGLDAFQEHAIEQLHHADYQLKHCYPCQRCIMPTINIDTGERHPQQQPFSCIADINAMPNNAKAPAFGENAILLNGDASTIRVGDTLTQQ